MSSKIDPESLSPFGRLAVELDLHFSELTRISGQIQRLDIDTESGLDRAVRVLEQFAQHGQGIADGIQQFAKVLQEARDSSDEAAKVVAARAEDIRRRKEVQAGIRERLNRVEADMAGANASLSSFRKNGNSDQGQIRAELERINGDLKRFLTDAQGVKDDAAREKFKTIEHDAQNVLDALKSTCRKVDKVLGE